MLACGAYSKHTSSSVTFNTWQRNKNVHAFNFEKVPDEPVHSGQNTTDGRILRLEIEFQNHEAETLTAGARQFTLKPAIDCSEAVIHLFAHVTSMLQISNKGVSVTY